MFKNPPFFTLPTTSNSEDSDKQDEGVIRTKMIGEAPGEDLGYDPTLIPVEDIPDDD